MEVLSNLYSIVSILIVFYLALYWPKAMLVVRLDKEFSKMQGDPPEVSFSNYVKYVVPPMASFYLCEYLDMQVTKIMTTIVYILSVIIFINTFIARNFMQESFLYLVIALYLNLGILLALYLLEVWTALMALFAMNLGVFFWQAFIPPLAYRTVDKYAISYFKENGDRIVGRF